MSSPYRYRALRRHRAAALVLSLAVVALMALLVLNMGLLVPGGKVGERLTAISFGPQPSEKAAKTAQAKAEQPRQRADRRVAQPVPVPPVRAEAVPPLNLLKLSRADMAAADIGKMARAPAADSGAASQGSGAAYGPGAGPGGARLFNAEWYREPTRAELVTYMPRRAISGSAWAEIACRTRERYEVEDCRELGESPRGSGLSRALRQAAWQFKVRPPRIDGKPLIGAWVRIHFDWQEAKDDAPLEAGGD